MQLSFPLRPSLRALPLAVLASLVAALAPPGTAANGEFVQEPPAERVVVHVSVEGQLDPGTLALLTRAVRTARAEGASALVLEIDTPGGEIERMRQICYAIDEAREGGLTVVSWVNDEALSAGTWITIAADSVFMREGATIGAAQAVQLTPWGMQAVAEKYASAYRAWVRGWAERHDRSPAIAEAMADADAEVREVLQDGVRRFLSGEEWDDLVDRGEAPELVAVLDRPGELMTLTAAEAVRLDFADGLAESVAEVLEKVGERGARVQRIERSSSEDLLGHLSDLRLLFLFLGLLFAFVEIKVPGFGVPGILALVCFVVLFAGQYMVGLANVPHLVMFVLGVGLVAVELFVLPGTIWAGLAGMLLVVAGLVLSQLGPGTDLSNAFDRALLVEASFRMVLTAVASMIGMYAVSRFLPETPLLNRVVLAPEPLERDAGALPEASDEHAAAARVGAPGAALTDLRPVGKVVLDAAPALEYEARAAGDALERGARVRVVEVRGGRLVVEPDGVRSA